MAPRDEDDLWADDDDEDHHHNGASASNKNELSREWEARRSQFYNVSR